MRPVRPAWHGCNRKHPGAVYSLSLRYTLAIFSCCDCHCTLGISERAGSGATNLAVQLSKLVQARGGEMAELVRAHGAALPAGVQVRERMIAWVTNILEGPHGVSMG